MIDITLRGRRFALPPLIVICLLIFFLVFGLTGGFSSRHYLVVSSAAGKKLFIPVEKDETFTLRYIHSIDLQPVYEFYRISPANELVLLEIRVHSFGAGLGDWQGKLVLEQGLQAVKEINLHLRNLPLRVGRIAEHTFIMKHQEFPLHKEFKGGELVTVSIQRIWGPKRGREW
ncbi:MAG: DUF1850 domain-containing protein [Dethiobacter sp.]|jgi:hypothetical protein|nr:DUF1850 domain-containing protein [Dethiobacter sp.]